MTDDGLRASFWVVGARVVDGVHPEPSEPVDVHIDGGRIVELGRAPRGVHYLDASGLTLTPGLIDAHVHLGLSSHIQRTLSGQLSVAEVAADIFANCAHTLRSGFTTVRDTGGVDGGLASLLAAGKIPGPRVIPCGPVQCQRGGHGHLASAWEPSAAWSSQSIPGLRDLALLSDGPEDMRANVREAFRRGAQFVKLCVTGGVVSHHDDLEDTQLTMEEIRVAVAEATARRTYVTVHAHNNRGIRNAVLAGVRCVEHGSQIDEETAQLLVTHDVAHVPTLAVAEQLCADAAATGLAPEVSARAERVFASQKEAVLISRATGVRVGLGSDLIGPDQSHRGTELQLRAALEDPMSALVSATRINAEILGVQDCVGTITVGKQADMVGWSTSPIDDAAVFANPDAAVLVIQRGHIRKDSR